MEIREIRDDQGFADLAPAWRDLHTRSETRNVYLAHEFLHPWWAHLGRLRGGAADRPGGLGRDSEAIGVRIALGVEGDRVVGLAPFQYSNVTIDGLAEPVRVLSLLGDVFITRYRDFLVERGRDADFVGALWSHLCGAGEEWDVVLLGGLHEESTAGQLSVEALNRLAPQGLRHVRFRSVTAGGPTEDNLKEAREDARLASASRATPDSLRPPLRGLADSTSDADLTSSLTAFAAANPSIAPVLERSIRRLRSPFQDMEYPYVALSGAWADYKASLTKNTRDSLRLNPLTRLGEVDYEVVSEDFDVDAHFDDLVRLHHHIAGVDSMTLNARTVGAQKAILLGLARRGWLRLAFLRVNRRRIAAIVSFDGGDRRYVSLVGRDPETPGSPGLLMMANAIEDAMSAGMKEVDLGPGDIRYKQRFSHAVRKVTNLLVKRDTVGVGLRDFAPRLLMFG